MKKGFVDGAEKSCVNVLDKVLLLLAGSLDLGGSTGDLLAARGSVANACEEGGEDAEGELWARGVLAGGVSMGFVCSSLVSLFFFMCLYPSQGGLRGRAGPDWRGAMVCHVHKVVRKKWCGFVLLRRRGFKRTWCEPTLRPRMSYLTGDMVSKCRGGGGVAGREGWMVDGGWMIQ